MSKFIHTTHIPDIKRNIDINWESGGFRNGCIRWYRFTLSEKTWVYPFVGLKFFKFIFIIGTEIK